jgi:Cu/Ag efflux pump CusA
VKQFQIQVDPMRLVANGITLDAVIAAGARLERGCGRERARTSPDRST